MAAKDLDNGDISKKELDDMVTCCICTEVYIDPKMLPCIHTFCMKCLQKTGLKTNKGPGDEMPCPICRRFFKIPPAGFQALAKNAFLESLMRSSTVSNQSFNVLCDACRNETTYKTSKSVPAAVTYCAECNHKFCEECYRRHGKFRLTRHHKLSPIDELKSNHNVMMTNLGSSVCEIHEQNLLDVYCIVCKTVVCSICFNNDHSNHDGSHVDKFVDGFRKQIEISMKAIDECRSQAETKKAELLKVHEYIPGRVEQLESFVEMRKHELKQFTDKHASSLLQNIDSIRQSKLKAIEVATSDIDTCLSSFEMYNSYCQKLLAKGSASDICRAHFDLSVRAVELQQQCQPVTQGYIHSFNFCIRKSEFEVYPEDSSENLIGMIEEVGNSVPRTRSAPSSLAEKRNEIHHLRNQVEIERMNKNSLQLENEQLRMKLDNEVKANKTLADDLSKGKANNSLQAKNDKLKQELEKEKNANRFLQANNDNMKHELNALKAMKNVPQSNEDRLRHALDRGKTTNSSLQSDDDKLKCELDAGKLIINLHQSNSVTVKQETDKEKLANSSLQSENRKLKEDMDEIAKIVGDISLPLSRNDNLSQELDKKTVATFSFQAECEKLKQEQEANKIKTDSVQTKIYAVKRDTGQKPISNSSPQENVVGNSPQASSRKIVEGASCRTTTRLSLFQENSEKCEQRPMKLEKPRCKSLINSSLIPTVGYRRNPPALVHTIKTKAAQEEGKAISGLTILDRELFVVNNLSSEVEVYDTMKMKYTFSRRWNLKELIDPKDVASSGRDKCLYIFNFRGLWKSNEILRVDPNGNLIKNWSTGDDSGYGLSVTVEANVILTVFEKNKLNEYSPDGQLIREIDLLLYASIFHPLYTIKLISGHFLVSHGEYGDGLHRVCLVDVDERLKKSFIGKRESTLNVPVCLSVNRNGFVMVADRRNSRVLLLDSELELVEEILSKHEKCGIRFPKRILLGDSSDRLFVADDKSNMDGRIMIFKLK